MPLGIGLKKDCVLHNNDVLIHSLSWCTLRPESAKIIPLGSQGADLCFSKQNCMRVQNNQLASLPSPNFYKKLFLARLSAFLNFLKVSRVSKKFIS